MSGKQGTVFTLIDTNSLCFAGQAHCSCVSRQGSLGGDVFSHQPSRVGQV